MDVHGLHSCFASTLDANPNNRREAELQLNQASKAPGFISACLDIVLAQPLGTVQVSAAVYLKNKIVRNWEIEEYDRLNLIPEEEKAVFRERIIPSIIASSPQTRTHLISILQRIIIYDFPERWPNFLDITIQLLQSNDVQHVYAGAICLNEIAKSYKWRHSDTRRPLDRVIEVAFPLAIQISNSLLQEQNSNAGEIVHLLIKAYRSAINMELSPRLQDQANIVAWGTLFLQVVAKDVPLNTLPEDEEDREATPWWKAKKWAYRCLNRLFVKYGNSSSANDSTPEYKDFSKAFGTNFAPEILKAYLHQIQLWVGQNLWLSNPVLNCILEYFEQAVTIKSTWDILKPNVESLVSHVVFPLIRLTDEDLDLFENEPIEYIHKRIDIYFDDSPLPDVSATNFLVTLAEKRRRFTFNTILSFINSVVVAHQNNLNDEKSARQKEGALRMIGSLSHIILGKKSPVANMMEQFFVAYIFPDFQSQFGFLRVRACELLNRFSDAEFKDPNNISFIYTNVTSCLNDKYLPVQIEAALALQPLSRLDSIKNALSNNIQPVMEKLMSLSKQIDMDSLIGVMEEFVDVFSQQLAPFAVQLAEELRDQFLRLLGEMIEKSNTEADNIDSVDFGDYDEKSITATGILTTLSTLLLSLDHSPEIVAQIEHAILPVISAVLEHEQTEMYDDIFELIDSSSYCLKKITPNLWSILGLLHKTFKTSAIDFFQEILPVVENYVYYGADDFKTNPEYVRIFIDIVNTVFVSDDRMSVVDRTDVCRLIQTLLLNLRGSLDEYVQYFINISIGRLTSEKDVADRKQYLVNLINVTVNCIYYNPVLAFRTLEELGKTAYFFNLWFTNIENLSRVHDKKLSVIAIFSILSLPDDHIPQSIQPGLSQLLHGLVSILKTLPDAIQKREQLTKEFESDGNYYDSYDSLNTGDWDDEEEVDGEGDINDAENQEYVDFLAKEASRLEKKYDEDEDEYDDDIDEEPMYDSPLDKVNIFVVARDYFTGLQQVQARHALLGELNGDERSIVDSVIQQAFREEQQLQQQAQQQE
ncbi:armadillo-type protein [Lipomyces japonicus]|uniref:armadillo-type protein n=1 Tax=Lipomyces japonicus TaxID=56871 RepID=UPI0034CFD4BC